MILRSGADTPVMRTARSGEEFFKVVPSGTSPTPHTPFFISRPQLDQLATNPASIPDVMGLPEASVAFRYDVYGVAPRPGMSPVVFESQVARTVENGITRNWWRNAGDSAKPEFVLKPCSGWYDPGGRPMMNYKELVAVARRLEDMLRQLAPSDTAAAACLDELTPYFEEIRRGGNAGPWPSVPCGYHFHEGALRKYRELEEVYSTFSVLARGIDRDDLARFIDTL